MQFSLTDDQRLIQESARTFLAENAGLEPLRKVLESGSGFDAALWQSLAQEMGFAGTLVPEAYGGSGLSAIEMSLILEETGRTLAVVPFFETAVLAVQAILSAGNEAQRAALLPELAAGNLKAAFAMADERGLPYVNNGTGVSVTLQRDGAAWRLNGVAGFVTFAHVADLLMVVARAPDSSDAPGISLLALPANTPGIHIERVPNLDLTRPFGRVTFNHVAVNDAAILGEPYRAGAAVARTLAVGAGLLAAEQTGGAEFCLTSTVDYAKQRVQFGRLIGSFQAVKHELADMMVAIEAARSAALYAATAIALDSDELFEACAVARVWCCEAYKRCASEAIQLHGGIGFTWEHHAHLYFKRARSTSTWFGEPAVHRERIAQLIGLNQE